MSRSGSHGRWVTFLGCYRRFSSGDTDLEKSAPATQFYLQVDFDCKAKISHKSCIVPFCPLHGVPGLQHWVGRKDFSLTNPMNGLYCSLHVDGFSRYSIPAYCTVVMTFLLGFEVAISYKYWRTRATTARAFTLLKRDLPFSLILRMLLFSVVSVMVISIGIIYMSNWLVPWPYMMQATCMSYYNLGLGSNGTD
ncbi:uncharacterized protein C8R40DRAFT_1075906 [Lentinula edodes]|uniref:uncharacterized protein n=1 Tax=Lentinula edodes TaxID=5353 RepID=UPI001E8E03FB|nr:uncharacterized protein C8R40DRAFT_1075906 [Lentinula edodes]KAH7880944.1 hypothetical protein C8R40DRAFT_1075906 [Lentinula edodes]